MLKRLFIIGAGGFGRQLESYIDDENSDDNFLPLTGFLDDNPEALAGKGTERSVMGSPLTFEFCEGDAVIIAIADSAIRRKLFEALEGKTEFFTYVSKRAIIGKNTAIGPGSVICPGANIGSNVTLNKGCIINLNAIIGHDSELQEFCSVMPHVDVGGNTRIGRLSFIGTKATITPNNTLAEQVNIGVGAVVIKEVKEQGTYFGNPARRML